MTEPEAQPDALDELKSFIKEQIGQIGKGPETAPPRKPLLKNHLEIQHEYNREVHWLVGKIEQCIDKAVAKKPETEGDF